jgi:choline-sulfatase
MKRTVVMLVVAAIASVAVWTQLRRAPQGARSTVAHRNVVLITIDTLRADRIGRGLTPAIDKLAVAGRSYAGVRATAPLTLPSHVSLMTGTIPAVHGVRENGVVFDRKIPTIARVFKEAGYRTGAFVGAYVLSRRFGLDEGFDTYDDSVQRDAARVEMLEAERPGAAVVDSALAWLGSQARSHHQPFFLWIHLYDPHAPYEPPAEFRGLGGHAYDGEVAYADAQIARVIGAVEAGGAIGNTVVAVTGDHGESLGEHGENTHGMLLYDGALRVPLVISGIAELPALAPCHQDVGPGLLRIAGLAERLPATMRGATPAGCGAYSESRYPRRAGWHALTALTDERWKLILSSEQELYDLQADPGESRNVAASNPGVVQGMAAALAKMQPRDDRTSSVAPEAAERLRALGYASGSSITSDDPTATNPARVIAAWTSFEEALALLRGGSAADAARALKRLADAHRESPVFQSTYAQALREAGDPGAAVQVYRAAVARWRNDPSLFHDLAAAAREAGNTDEAMRAEQAALALDASSPMAQNGVGLLHADAGRFTDAIAAFGKATEGDPTNPSYWTNLGNARRGSGDTAGAEAAYRSALGVDAEHADALNGLGVILVQSGRASEAVPLFERALRRDPELYEARLNLGIAYQESEQTQKARETYQEVLKKTPPRYARERNAAAQLLRSFK